MGLFYCNLRSFPYTNPFASPKYTHISGLQQSHNLQQMKLNQLSVKHFYPWNNRGDKKTPKKFEIKNFIIKISGRSDTQKFPTVRGGGAPAPLCRS